MAFMGAIAAVNMAIVNQGKRTCPACKQPVPDRDDYTESVSGQRTHTGCGPEA
jgi:hypothetical protein